MQEGKIKLKRFMIKDDDEYSII